MERRFTGPEGIEILVDEADSDVQVEFASATSSPSRSFTLIRVIGPLYFFTGDPSSPTLVDGFKKDVIIKAPIPPDFLAFLEMFDIALERIRLGYYDKKAGNWVAFQSQSLKYENNRNIVEVNFSYWIKDPNVGWGFL